MELFVRAGHMLAAELGLEAIQGLIQVEAASLATRPSRG
jgi:hypothetical protein